MSFFCSDHHLFIAGAPRGIICPCCGAAVAGAHATGGYRTCPVCASGWNGDAASSPAPYGGTEDEQISATVEELGLRPGG